MANPLDVVILAAGKGVRMRSRIPKVLHPLAGLPLLEHVLRTASTLAPHRIVVVGPGGEEIKQAFPSRDLLFVDQGAPLEAGGAVLAARPALSSPTFLVLPGDVPLVPEEALQALLDFHRKRGLLASFLTMAPPDPGNHGRVVRREGHVVRIIEAKGASPEELSIREVDSGIWCLSNVARLWEVLEGVPPTGAQGEHPLTALVEPLVETGQVDALLWPTPEDLLGVKDRVDLARLEGVLRARITTRLMEAGVSIPDPNAVYLSPDVQVGLDTVLHPGTHLWGSTRVGEGCEIGPGAYLIDTQVEAGVKVWFSVLEGAWVEEGARIGPYAHLRPGARVGPRARVGNFVEVKNATLGEGVKAGHLAYIGDAEVGPRANIGAGTITCNYDGIRKYRTEIGPGAFIGSNAALVAPVRIGEGAYVGAGSVITADVPPYALALGRAVQTIRPEWAKKRREGGK
ncbi:TPA: UDP-N-acetylglucosamine diphosphorylase/glucosamine-1-phosphate N-acetyltransferase [Candidatus Bipolaricaulota bacterium]|nr:UDP-N-acetylglucosamine diphosphorylase/glucosamine-1-phosphate N-acetyltransferase [Candidatus Bipolaricaulota bacterium]